MYCHHWDVPGYLWNPRILGTLWGGILGLPVLGYHGICIKILKIKDSLNFLGQVVAVLDRFDSVIHWHHLLRSAGRSWSSQNHQNCGETTSYFYNERI